MLESEMASKSNKPVVPHFLLIPAMAQGHLIPMADLAKLLSQNGAKVSLITTPQNTSRIQSLILSQSQSQIQILELQFPCHHTGLPQGCENFDSLPSNTLIPNYLTATTLLCRETEDLFEQLSPRPSCIVSDMALPWTIRVAHKFNVPRLVFYSLSSLYLLAMAKLRGSDVIHKLIAANSDSEVFVVPDLPHPLEITKQQLIFTLDPVFLEWGNQMAQADSDSYGFILNSFHALEPTYLHGLNNTLGDKVWCVGPVSMCNKDTSDKAIRGNKAGAIDEDECVEWLDRQQPGSVIYAALGSLCNVVAAQIIELGLALQASNRPFIWVIRQTQATNNQLENWLLESGFEQRTKKIGLVVRGWAPQLLILSHPGVGAFVTHCGWNSTIEGISAGVPMVAWPLFADQMFNEKMIVEILRVGVGVGVEKSCVWGGEEEVGVQVKMEAIRDGIEKVMSGEGNVEMRRRVRDLAQSAKAAMEQGGSSQLSLKLLVEDIRHQAESTTSGS